MKQQSFQPRVDPKWKDVVEVVDDAAEQGQAGQDDEHDPEDSPAGTPGQVDVVEAVGRRPQVEAWNYFWYFKSYNSGNKKQFVVQEERYVERRTK